MNMKYFCSNNRVCAALKLLPDLQIWIAWGSFVVRSIVKSNPHFFVSKRNYLRMQCTKPKSDKNNKQIIVVMVLTWLDRMDRMHGWMDWMDYSIIIIMTMFLCIAYKRFLVIATTTKKRKELFNMSSIRQKQFTFDWNWIIFRNS